MSDDSPIKTTVYGTAEDCDVRITDDPYVSGHHAKVTEWPDGSATLEDLGSMNSTYWARTDQPLSVMAGTKVWRAELLPFDRFRVGRTWFMYRSTTGGGA